MRPIVQNPQNIVHENCNNPFEELKVNPEFVKKLHLFYRTGNFSKKKSKKSKFSKEEDEQLCKLVKQYGENEWAKVSKHMKNRNPRQVRERWKNYLNPQVNTDKWTEKEDLMLISKFNEIGPHWKKISSYFENRSVNAIRNRFVKITNNNKYLISNSFNFSNNQFQNSNNSLGNSKHSSETENQILSDNSLLNPIMIDNDDTKVLASSQNLPKNNGPTNNIALDYIQQPNYNSDEILDIYWDNFDDDDLDFLFSW